MPQPVSPVHEGQVAMLAIPRITEETVLFTLEDQTGIFRFDSVYVFIFRSTPVVAYRLNDVLYFSLKDFSILLSAFVPHRGCIISSSAICG